MRPLRIVPGRSIPPEAEGAVLVRDLRIGGERWPKGRRLSARDIAQLAEPSATVDVGPRGRAPGAQSGITVLVLESGDVHEDEAGTRLAQAVAGDCVALHGPAESRVDLRATVDGVLHVRAAPLARLNRIDPLEVFTLYDGQVVRAGDLVASVKIGPHAVPAAVLERGIRLADGAHPIVRVAPFIPRRVAALVKESVRGQARERFERSLRGRVESLGSLLVGPAYLPDDPAAVVQALRPLQRGPGRVDVVLTAGGASTDPTDAFFQAIERLGGRVVRHGVPAHPGSMVWLARIGHLDMLGLPTCGAYSKATAVDLLLPRLLTGERAGVAMTARLGHGGVLNRAMRFRFPAYAADLRAPEG